MLTRIHRLAAWMTATVLVCSCRVGVEKEQAARLALLNFFDKLSGGEYTAAVASFCGSYETLVSFNPDLDPDDHAGLWQRGCQVNGVQCLGIRTATFNERTAEGEYIFTVEFSNQDGSLFVRQACCGEDPTTAPQFQFEYRVVEGGDGQFRVLDMPVYVP